MKSTSIKNLQDYTVVSKYSRFIPELRRREVWDEAVKRMEDMHLERYPLLTDEIHEAFSLIYDRTILGSQRALQFGGPAVLRHNARLYNCTFSYCDRPRFFQEALYLLLCGSGTGFSVVKEHVAKMPPIYSCWWGPDPEFAGIEVVVPKPTKTFVIPDSIEGWSDAVGVLVSSFMDGPFPEYGGYDVVFEYHQIRKPGSLLSHGCGKAPGPEGLRNALENIRELLKRAGRRVGNGAHNDDPTTVLHLKPIECYDIVMYAADAVLSGGVRRSSTLCLFSPDDEEMMNAKTGNWYDEGENPQRANSNNSALMLRGATTFEEFRKLVQIARISGGEPAVVWTDHIDFLVNPCCEIGGRAYDENGLSGWQGCNLAEVNGSAIDSREKFFKAVWGAAVVSTLQAGYTDFPYLGPVTESIFRREALLGVSITGIMDSPEILLDPATLREAAAIVKKTNEEIAAKIGINPAARLTCIKPSGTAALVLGTSSGIHPHHAKKYLRRVQGNKLEAPLQYFKKINPLAVESSFWGETDEIITFCIEVPEGSRLKNQMSAIELLEAVKLMKINWVDAGKVAERCVEPWLSHNVSNTISIRKDEEWEEVTHFIYDNREHFAGITLTSSDIDKDYAQAPFCAVYTPTEIAKLYGDGSVVCSGIIEDALEVWKDEPAPLWKACSVLLGKSPVPSLPDPLGFSEKGDMIYGTLDDALLATKIREINRWLDRGVRFAISYFDGDLKKMSYCLKDVYDWKLWMDLTRTYKPVDYRKMVEDEDNTHLEAELACAGGACESSLIRR